MLTVLVIVAIVAVVGRYAAARPLLGRLRAVVPAWRFFDRATTSPALLVRFAADTGELGAWSSIHEARRPHRLRWLFAPHDNLALAYQSVVDQLVAELGELDVEESPDGRAGELAAETDPAVVGLVSYELVTRIARVHVPGGVRFQWKIVVAGEVAANVDEDYVMSEVFAG